MAVWVAWIVFGIALLVLIGLIWAFLSYYKSQSDGNDWTLTLFVCSLALFFAFLSLIVIPVDVYFASSLNEYKSGSKRNDMEWVYYGFDIVLLCFVFAIMPFAYFYFEESGVDADGRQPSRGKKACGSLKFTFGFVIVFVVLIVIGAFINFNSSSSSSDANNNESTNWKNKVTDSFNSHSSRIVPFCLAILMSAGLFLSMIYTSWGLASIPINLMRSMTVKYRSLSRDYSQSKSKSLKGAASTESDLKSIRMDLEDLDNKYVTRDGPWSNADREKRRQLLEDKRKLEVKIRKSKDNNGGGGRRGGGGGGGDGDKDISRDNGGDNVCCALLWNGSAPVRYVVGLGLLAWGGLIVACMIMHLLDQALNSDCGYSCGFQVQTYKYSIPIETMLSKTAKFFPLDYILFAVIILWLFIATIAGVVALDVRVLCFKFFRFVPRGTMQNGLILGVGFIVIISASFAFLVMTLAPNYTSYGHSGNNSCSVVTCDATAVYYILSGIQIGMPIFGLIYFVFSWIFVVVFFLSFLWNACRSSGSRRKANDDDDLEDEFKD